MKNSRTFIRRIGITIFKRFGATTNQLILKAILKKIKTTINSNGTSNNYKLILKTNIGIMINSNWTIKKYNIILKTKKPMLKKIGTTIMIRIGKIMFSSGIINGIMIIISNKIVIKIKNGSKKMTTSSGSKLLGNNLKKILGIKVMTIFVNRIGINGGFKDGIKSGKQLINVIGITR